MKLWPLALVVLSSLCQAGMYKCQQNGSVVYQDQPCASTGQTLKTGISPSAGSASVNPAEIRQAPSVPTEALYRELVGSWCEDAEATFQIMSALTAGNNAAPSYQALLSKAQRENPAAYAEMIKPVPVATLYANHTAREANHSTLLTVTMGKEGFAIGSEGLTIYRHGQHFYRGSHEFHRIPLKRCAINS